MSGIEIVGSAITKASVSLLLHVFKTYKNRIRENTLKNEVGKFIDTFNVTELDSGAFYEFIENPSTERDFIDYVEFCVYKKKPVSRKVGTMLNRKIFIDHLTTKAISFVEKESGKKISFLLVNKYFNNLMDILEDRLIKNISIDQLGIIYFVNSSIEETGSRILESLQTALMPITPNYEEISKDYLQIIKNRNKQSHVYGINDLNFYSFYVFPNFFVRKADEEEKSIRWEMDKKVEWKEVFKESNVISIIGGAGFGKSLFLKNVINKFSELNLRNSNNLIPIYCDLKQFIINGKGKSSYSIKEFLLDSMIANSGMHKEELSKGLIDYFLDAGRCLILFDALDEVELTERQSLNELISAFFQETNKYNKVIITSRSQGFVPKTRLLYEVCPVDEEQIKNYLENMIKLKEFKAENVNEFISQCETLISNNFLKSFLVVSLLVQIYKAEKELPENKIDLYEKCVEYISKKRERDQKKQSFDFKLINEMLDNNVSFEKLAWLARPNNIEIKESEIKEFFVELYQDSYGSKNETKNAVDEFLRFCSQRTELYVLGNQEDHYHFYHRSFYEFFYSRCIINESKNEEELFSILNNFGFDSEIFEITISLLKKHNYSKFKKFIEYIYDHLNRLDISNKSTGHEENEDSDTFIKICLMLNVSELIQYSNKVYDYLLSEQKPICNFDQRISDKVISSLLNNVADKMNRDLQADIMKYYKEEIVEMNMLNFLLEKSRSSSIRSNITFKLPDAHMLFFELSYMANSKDIIKALSELKEDVLRNKFQNIVFSDEEDNVRYSKFINNMVNKFKKEASFEEGSSIFLYDIPL